MILDFIKKIFSPIIAIVDKAVPDKDKKNELKAHIKELEIQISGKLLDYEVKLMQAQASVIEKEAGGESWLQRNWRPGLMALFGIIIANNYIINPYMKALFNIDVMMPIPTEMWGLLKLGVSGYVVGRSVEKAVKVWKGN